METPERSEKPGKKKESRTATYFKKKKKKSFLQNAKSFGKKGNFGRGSSLEKPDYDYLLEILKNINAGFEDDESKELMANNVFEQTVKGTYIS
jgi:nucleolar protein 9